jgi:hypothetical protein
MRFPYLVGLGSALHGAGLPYGFTITVFSSGQGLVHFHGPPAVGLLFLFATGAAAAYGMLKLLSRRAAAPVGLQLGASPHPVRAGVIHVAAINLAIGSAMIAGLLLPAAAAWPLAALFATLIYLSVVGLEMALIEREENP